MDYWRKKLAEPIELRSGGTLKTLANARTYLLETFGTNTYSSHLAETVSDLMRAAETGEERDIRKATAQLKRFLMFRRK